MKNIGVSRSLREWRLIRFMKQQELADKLGVSNHTVSNWEKGYKRPSPEHMRKLTEVLKVDAEQIILPSKGEESPAA